MVVGYLREWKPQRDPWVTALMIQDLISHRRSLNGPRKSHPPVTTYSHQNRDHGSKKIIYVNEPWRIFFPLHFSVYVLWWAQEWIANDPRKLGHWYVIKYNSEETRGKMRLNTTQKDENILHFPSWSQWPIHSPLPWKTKNVVSISSSSSWSSYYTS